MTYLKNCIVAICLTGFSCIPVHVFCQNMNRPYSVFGIGDIDYRSYNRTSGMGGTGMALRSATDLIDNNPASIAGLPRSFFIFHGGAVGATFQYSGNGIDQSNRSNRDFWIKTISLAIKINKVWASSLGFKQFSNVNYVFNGTKNIIGENATYAAQYSGDGGLNEYYWTNAFSLGKHFSIGVKSSIIAGGINQTEIITNAASTNTITTKLQDYYGDPRFEFGAIYATPVNKHWDVSLGGKFIPQTSLGSERTLNVMQNAAVIVNNEAVSNGNFSLPETYSVGLALTHDKKATFAADYTFENWTPLSIGGNGWHMVNNNRLSAGMEIAKHVQAMGQSFEKSYLQFGGFISNSYLQVNNTPVNEFGITAGKGGIFNANFLYSFSLEVGERGTTANNLIRENFFRLGIALTYRDFLLSKGRKYD